MTDLQLMQQALEALELGYDAAKAEADQYHAAMAGYRPERHARMDAEVQQIAAAITALKAALAEPQEPSEMVLVPRELLERASESLGAFVSDHGWAQADMDVMDDIDWTLAASCAHPALQRQPLTDEAILAMVKTAPALDTAEAEWLQVARAIEKAHGIGGQDE